MQFDAKELAAATSGYRRSHLICKGGYGSVYKGTVRGCVDVAIKVLTQVGCAMDSHVFSQKHEMFHCPLLVVLPKVHSSTYMLYRKANKL